MIYRTFTLTTLPTEWQTADIKDTLSYATTGAIANYEIKEDYLSPKNSTINIIAKSYAVVGQIITLIDDSGVYAMGVVTAVDNEQRQIMFRDILDLFSDEALNPLRDLGKNDSDIKVSYLYDGILDTAEILKTLYLGNVDKYRRSPLVIKTSGGGITNGEYNEPVVFDYTENSFNIRNWIMELFDKNNIIMQARLVFETNRAYIELNIFKNTTSGWLLKNNIPSMTISKTEDRSPKATVCQVLYKGKDENDNTYTQVIEDGTYYLLADNTVTNNANAEDRVQPYKLTIAELDIEKATAFSRASPQATPKSIAENALKYKDFSTYVSIEIDRNSLMYPKNMRIGDGVTIVPKLLDIDQDSDIMTAEEYKKYTIDSVYTGKSEKSDNSRVMLYFGKIRVDYTDIMYLESYKKVRH